VGAQVAKYPMRGVEGEVRGRKLHVCVGLWGNGG
jgi:hypothetical protein